MSEKDRFAPSDPARLRGRTSIDGSAHSIVGRAHSSEYPSFGGRSRIDNTIRTGTILKVMLVLGVLGSAGYDACMNHGKTKSMRPDSSAVVVDK